MRRKITSISTVIKTVIKELKELAMLQALAFVYKQGQMKNEDKEKMMYTDCWGTAVVGGRLFKHT